MRRVHVRGHMRKHGRKTHRVSSHYKYVPTTSVRRVKHRQTGKSNRHADYMRKAKRVGWRRSASGRWYYEGRRNRSDRSGSRL